jgi:hypothetical protein
MQWDDRGAVSVLDMEGHKTTLWDGWADEQGLPWPIYLQTSSGPVSVDLKPGDALLYGGIKLEHWRDVFRGLLQVQVFLHYVDKKGRYADRKYDGRDGLNLRCKGAKA